jgi:hypothetical protein
VAEIIRLQKVLNTKPQQFKLVLRDKVQRTEFGAEGEVRTMLKAVGIRQPDIDKLFERTISENNTEPT